MLCISLLAILETISRSLRMPFRRCAWRLASTSPPPQPQPQRFARVGLQLPTSLGLSPNAPLLGDSASRPLSPLLQLFSALPADSVLALALRSALSWRPAAQLSPQLSLPYAFLQPDVPGVPAPPFAACSWQHGWTSARA